MKFIKVCKTPLIAGFIFLFMLFCTKVCLASPELQTSSIERSNILGTLYNEQTTVSNIKERCELNHSLHSYQCTYNSDPIFDHLIALKEKYPPGKYWNHYVSDPSERTYWDPESEKFSQFFTDHPCNSHDVDEDGDYVGLYNCNYFDEGIQCAGFAFELFYELYGIRASDTDIIEGNQGVQVGDAVRLSVPEISGHSGIILSIDSNTFTLAEANAHDTCMIEWGTNTYNISQIEYYQHAKNYDDLKNRAELFFMNSRITLKPQTSTYVLPVLHLPADNIFSFADAEITSSTPEIVTIDLYGKVHAIAPGEAVLTAETADGLKATCRITVEK